MCFVVVVATDSDLEQTSTGNSSSESVSVEVLLRANGQREADLRVVELLDVRSSALARSNLLYADDLDRVSTGSVTSTHVTV